MSKRRSGSTSILLRLIIGLISVTVLGAAATSLLIYNRFVSTNSAFRDRTLQNDARIIGNLLRRASEGRPLQLPDFLTDNFQQGKGKFAVISDSGVLVAGSPNVTEPLSPIDEDGDRDFFLSETGGQKLYGFTLRGTYGSKPVWIQVAVPQSDVVYDSVLEEFIKDIGWIWVPFVFVLLGTNLVVARIGLQPLRRAAAQAESIGPGAVSTRLPKEGLPREIHPLVGAVNRALDRLEVAFQSQQRFIADAAHELRTPVAVLKAHAGLLPSSNDFRALKEEIDAIERLVNQLLDSARLDVVMVGPDEFVELNRAALAIASQMGPLAIGRGKLIEVHPSDELTFVRGTEELIAGALRNLVENGLKFTKVGTSVVIEVFATPAVRVSDHGPGVRPELRQAIFTRFWQGGRDRGGGAGLGLDIVSRSVAALGGSISLEDAPEGGAAFTIEFPKTNHRLPALPGARHAVASSPAGL
ncbi:MAG: HAMP domain-containing sensor histidine kinase [Hyphomicrobium sp.]|jgi:signal transduction histidine kinase